MSVHLFTKDILFYQRLLASMGFYSDKIDGEWGPNTDNADKIFQDESRKLRDKFGELDNRTEVNITTLHIKAQFLARRFLSDLASVGFGRSVKIISGTRTYEEQNKLYAKGRFGNIGPKVTNARGGYSNHNFGIAWDIGIFDGGKYLDGDSQEEIQWYISAAETANLDGLDWGGNWTTFKDRPHYEVKTGLTTEQKKNKFEDGTLSF
ncbi:M15 family metallopeptidase [Paracoccus marcusii]|uniref:M15 family metallopeptidase n=1 Tax=Paracoccus marcusii TaxID=59779 RepID=UPI0035A6C623